MDTKSGYYYELHIYCKLKPHFMTCIFASTFKVLTKF